MPALADVNLLLALAYEGHEHHAAAAKWFDRMGLNEVIVCRLAQLGMLRLLNNPHVGGDEALDVETCWAVWRDLLSDERIVFMPGEPAGLDETLGRMLIGRVFSPALWTDAYLAAFAQCGDFELVTFDKGFKKFAGLKLHLLSARKS